MGSTVSWTDIDASGRRMNKITKMCETMVYKLLKAKPMDHDLIMAYIDRLVKCSTHQSQLVNMNLKLNMLFKLAEKKHSDEIIDIGLKELVAKKK